MYIVCSYIHGTSVEHTSFADATKAAGSGTSGGARTSQAASFLSDATPANSPRLHNVW